MPPILTPPLLVSIDPDSLASQPHVLGGPFEYQTPQRIYQVLPFEQNANRVGVFKTLDYGATSWIEQDGANRPSVGFLNNPAGVFQDGTLLRVVFGNDVGNTLRVITFDTATDTWNVESADGPVVNNPGFAAARIYNQIFALASGALWVFYSKPTGLGGRGFYYSIYSGGAWTVIDAPIDVTIASNNDIRTVILDPGGTFFHCTYTQATGGGANPAVLKYRTVTDAGVISAAQDIFTAGAGDVYYSGAGAIWNGSIVIPFHNNIADGKTGVWVGTPSGAPVWAFTLLNGLVQPANTVDKEWFAFADTFGSIHVFWVSSLYPGNPADIIDSLYYSSNDGTGWTAAALYYDAVTNPPSPGVTDPYDQNIHFSSGTVLANGAFGILSGMETDTRCLDYWLQDALNPPIIDCGNPPAGVVGVAY